MNIKLRTITQLDIAAWIIMAVAMIFILRYNLLPGLLAGMLVFELVHVIAPYIGQRFSSYISKVIAVSLLAVIIVGALTLLGLGLAAFFRSDSGSLTTLIARMAQIIEDSRQILPGWIDERIPADAVVLQQVVTQWLRDNASSLQFLGKEAGRYAAHIVIGMVVGAMLALRDALRDEVDDVAVSTVATTFRCGRIVPITDVQ